MNLKRLVAELKLNRRKARLDWEAFEFPGVLIRPKQILVCLPGSLRQLTLVKQFLPTLTDLFRPAEITLLAMPGVMIADIFPRKGFRILTPTSDQTTWSGLARKNYLKILQENRYDLIIDLNLEVSGFTSSILLGFPNAVRIGRGNHLGRPYYNVEIKTKYLRDERNIYRSLFDMLGRLKGMGGKGRAGETVEKTSEV
jgi:hypothetical protein